MKYKHSFVLILIFITTLLLSAVCCNVLEQPIVGIEMGEAGMHRFVLGYL